MTYSTDMIYLVLEKVEKKELVVNIAKTFDISRRTIYRWIQLYLDTKLVYRNDFQLNKKRINAKKYRYYKSVINYVHSNKGCSIYDIYLNAVDKQISLSTISRICKETNISHKKISNKVVGKSVEEIEQDRTSFVNKMDFKVNDAIYIDEVSFVVSDHKRYGYGTKGEELTIIRKHKHNKERKTVIAAIDHDNLIATKIVDGSVNKEVYTEFLNDNKHVFKERPVIQDNARCHHAKTVKEFVRENNINYKFNPAYSPEFNPIELMFNKVKTEFRKCDHVDMVDDIEKAFLSVTTNDCHGFYRKTARFINNYKSQIVA